jgi:ribonuclease R
MVMDAEGQARAPLRAGADAVAASLNYEEVQAAIDGTPERPTAPLLAEVIAPLYAAYAALPPRARRASRWISTCRSARSC